MNNIEPLAEGMIRDSERIRIITSLLENEKYVDDESLRIICGVTVRQQKNSMFEEPVSPF